MHLLVLLQVLQLVFTLLKLSVVNCTSFSFIIRNLSEIFQHFDHCHVHVYPINNVELEEFSVPLQTIKVQRLPSSKKLKANPKKILRDKWWDYFFVDRMGITAEIVFKSMLLSYKHLNCIAIIQFIYPINEILLYKTKLGIGSDLSYYYRRNSLWNDILVQIGSTIETMSSENWSKFYKYMYTFTGANVFFEIVKDTAAYYNISTSIYTYVDKNYEKLEGCEAFNTHQICLQKFYTKHLNKGKNMIFDPGFEKTPNSNVEQVQIHIYKMDDYNFIPASFFGFRQERNSSITKLNFVNSKLHNCIRSPFSTNLCFLDSIKYRSNKIGKTFTKRFWTSIFSLIFDVFNIYHANTGITAEKLFQNYSYRLKEVSSYMPNIVTSTFHSYHSDEFRDLIITHTAKLNFVTCNGVRCITSFQHYFVAYDLVCWIYIVATNFLILPIFLALVVKWFDTTFIALESLKYMLMYCLSSLLEVGMDFPNKSRKAGKYYKCVLGCWLAILVVLVNGYKGIFTSHVLSPIPVFTLWKDLRHNMSHFDYFMDHNMMITMSVLSTASVKKKPKRAFIDVTCYYCLHKFKPNKICTKHIKSREADVHEDQELVQSLRNFSRIKNFGSIIVQNEEDCIYFRNKSHHSSKVKYSAAIYASVPDKVPLFPSLSNTTTILTKWSYAAKTNLPTFEDITKFTNSCRTVAFIDIETRLQGFLAYTKSTSKNDENEDEAVHYYTGSDPWNYLIEGFMLPTFFPPTHTHFIKQRLRDIIEFGIYEIWFKWDQLLATIEDSEASFYIRRYNKKELDNHKPKVLTLKGKIKAVFLIWCFCIIISSLSLVIEKTIAHCWF